jgi:hypothetical protein
MKEAELARPGGFTGENSRLHSLNPDKARFCLGPSALSVGFISGASDEAPEAARFL